MCSTDMLKKHELLSKTLKIFHFQGVECKHGLKFAISHTCWWVRKCKSKWNEDAWVCHQYI